MKVTPLDLRQTHLSTSLVLRVEKLSYEWEI